MKPFTDRHLQPDAVPEPAASTQSVYHSLDAVVEAVLTDKNANIPQLLNEANSAAQAPDPAGQVVTLPRCGGWAARRIGAQPAARVSRQDASRRCGTQRA